MKELRGNNEQSTGMLEEEKERKGRSNNVANTRRQGRKGWKEEIAEEETPPSEKWMGARKTAAMGRGKGNRKRPGIG